MFKSKIRRSISLLMAVVMLLSTFAVGSNTLFSRGNVAAAESVPVLAEVPESVSAEEFVRIKNKWTSHYLYEDENGIIRYGFPATTDTSSHWAIEAETSGYTTIRNKATGRYITMANVEARSSMLTSEEVADTVNEAWIIEPAVNREGQFTIRSAKFAGESYFIHEEDQLGYAQVSGDIGAEWESPQWSFEPAPSSQAVRIYNKYRQAYIYEVTEDGEDQGKIEYGQIPYTDAASHWYVDEVAAVNDEDEGTGGEAGGKIIELRNALTGNVITQGTFWAHITAKPQMTSTKSHWVMAAAPSEGYITFSNVYAAEGGEDAPDEIPQGTYVLNTQFEDPFVRSNDWSNVNNDNAQWRIEIVPAVQPVRLVNYSDISDESSKIYLFEEDGLVKYGALDADSAAYQWVLEDYNGNKRIRNLSSGRYISSEHIEDSTDPLEVLHDDGGAGQWKLNESGLYDNFVSIESVLKAGQFIHVAEQTGYAQAGIVQPTDSDAQWYLEDPTTSADGEPQIVQIRNVWNSMYLYEDDNHVLKYGNARPGDQRAQWIITRYNGRNLIQNRATGHYLNILHQTTGQLPLSNLNIAELTEAELQNVLWRIKDNGGGKNIWSARDLNNVPGEQAYINLQNLTKYAEYSAVNPNWGSPKWQFVNVTDDAMQYVRIRSKTTNEYLYEEDDIVKYGSPAETDFNSHWYIEEADGSKVIRNRATGHYISMQPAGSDESEIENTALPVRSIEVEAAWASHKWIVEEDGEFIAFKNGWTNDHYLTTRDELDYLQRIRSAELASTEAEDSKWFAFENAPDMSQYVRIKNKDTDDYWYEQDKQLKYGNVDIADSRTHWFLEDAGDGAQYVRNRATGHYINIEFMDRDDSESAISVEHFEMEWGSASPKWIVEPANTPGHIQFRNVWNDWRYLSTKDELGHVQQVEHAEADDDSIQFVMEGVPAGQLLLPTEAIRIKNAANDQYLLQTPQNIVAYGEPAADNAYSHWTIESIDGVQRVRNQATGMYISLTPDYRYVEMTVDGSTEKSNWIVEGAPIGDAYMIRSNLPGYTDEYLNTISALGYPEHGLQLISDQSLHWIFEAAPAEAVTPPHNEDDAANAVTAILDDSNFVRIVNKSSGELLHEQDGELVASSSAASLEDEARAQWLLQDYNGHKLLKNKATGQLLYVSADGISLAEVSNRPIELGAQWKLHTILGYQKFESVLQRGQWLRQAGDHIHYGVAEDAASEWTLDPVAGVVRYEAEKAFASGGATVVSSGAGSSVEAGYATGFTETGARIIMAVNGQADEEYEGVIRFRNPAAAAQTLTLKVNGLSLDQLEFAATGQGTWQEVEVMLPLRTGYNSVSLERTAADTGTGQVEIDAVVVQNNINLAYRGATLPYSTYEAEHMATNGTLIGPSRVYLDVASEASGRQAVKLDQTGHYVEFQAAQEANSIVVRYSIPDAPTGGGIESTIGVYVDGEFRTELNLNSAYAWVYGNYPWSNDPKQGSAHRFFDDAHALVGDIPAGSTVRLEVREADDAEYYIVDLIDLELVAPALEMPNGFLSITDFGAIANDGLDDTAALRATMEAAKAEEKGVWIPAGTFEVGDGLLILDDITIRGAGKWYTKLNEAKFFGNGSNIGVYDLMIDGKISVRDDEAQTNGFEGAFGPGSTVQHVWIEHTKTGLWLTRPINKGGYTFNTDLSTNEFYIAGSRIRNMMADGMNFSVNTKNSMAEHMNIRYPGDDGMAMWSFLEHVPTDFTENNTYRFNTVQLPWLANNIIVFGGKNHKIQDNIVMDTVAHGAGISVSTKFTPTPYEGTILVERNTLIRTGSDDAGAGYSTGAIWIYAYDRDIDTEVNIRHNTALDSTYYGLSIGGARTLGSVDSQRAKVTVEDMVIDGTGLTGVQISSTIKGAINFKNVVIRNTKLGNIHNAAGTNFTIHDLDEEQEPNHPRPGNPGSPDPNEGLTHSGSVEDNDKRLGEGPTKQQTIELSVDAQGRAELSLAALLAAAEQHPTASVVVSSKKASYALPLALAEVIKQYAAKDHAAEGDSDGTLVIKVSDLSEQLRGELADQALAAGLEVTSDPVHFQLLLKQGNSQLELTNFGRTYMQHLMTIEGKLDSKLATVMSYDPVAKAFRYAPARFSVQGDDTTVTVMSPSNGIFVVVQGMKTFSDISNHWARESIELLATKRIVFGKSADHFAPQHAITRAEFSALLVRSLGLRDGGSTMHFSDIQPADWFHSDVTIAAQYSIVSGFGDGRFKPNDTITREQMAVMAANALAISGSAEGAAAVFHDKADISPWARSAVEHIVQQGIMNGKQVLHFAPKDEATRAEAVIVLMRMLQSMELLDE